MAKPRVMIVEDEVIVAADLQATLKRLGYEILTIALSGEETLRRIEEVKPDVVLVDIILQGDLDGIEIAQKIREHLPLPIPIVYLLLSQCLPGKNRLKVF